MTKQKLGLQSLGGIHISSPLRMISVRNIRIIRFSFCSLRFFESIHVRTYAKSIDGRVEKV